MGSLLFNSNELPDVMGLYCPGPLQESFGGNRQVNCGGDIKGDLNSGFAVIDGLVGGVELLFHASFFVGHGVGRVHDEDSKMFHSLS